MHHPKLPVILSPPCRLYARNYGKLSCDLVRNNPLTRMALHDELSTEVGRIFRERWDVTKGTVVPESEDIALGNEGVELDATVLYADLAESTNLVKQHSVDFAGEVYKTYLYCAAKIIRSEGGEITAYDGDRVMAVYVGATKNSSATRTALKINYAVREI